MKKIALTIVLFLIAGLFLLWPGSSKATKEFDVVEGATAWDVARDLQQQEIIQFRLPFLFWVKIRGIAPKIKVGRYQFADGRSAFWLADDLQRGRILKAKLIVPEGFAIWQIAERVDESKIGDGAAFAEFVKAKKLEGYLFPATYDLGFGLGPASIADRLVEEFDRRWTPEMDDRARELKLTKHQIVTLASIIEREVRVPDERKLVSAVYHNRLVKRMRLQADPTVQYALGYWKSPLTYNDYRDVKSPYNTYLVNGLPPGPICSPGSPAIEAALWPEKSDALFFVATEDGRHTFSTTYRDHTNKVNRRNRKKRGR